MIFHFPFELHIKIQKLIIFKYAVNGRIKDFHRWTNNQTSSRPIKTLSTQLSATSIFSGISNLYPYTLTATSVVL